MQIVKGTESSSGNNTLSKIPLEIGDFYPYFVPHNRKVIIFKFVQQFSINGTSSTSLTHILSHLAYCTCMTPYFIHICHQNPSSLWSYTNGDIDGDGDIPMEIYQ